MTPEQLSALKARLADEDVAPPLTEEQVATLLTTPPPQDKDWPEEGDQVVWLAVPIVDARSIFRSTMAPGQTMETPGGPMTAIVALRAAASNSSHPIRNVAEAARELFMADSGMIDCSNAGERDVAVSLLSTLANAGEASILSEDAFNALRRKMWRYAAWDETAGWTTPRLSSLEVGRARQEMANEV